MTLDIFGKKFKLTFLIILLAEMLSFTGYIFSPINKLVFVVLVVVTLILSLYKLEYGIFAVLGELFIGSKGYLFYFTAGKLVVSVRIAMWATVMAVWFFGLIASWIKTKKLDLHFFRSKFLVYFGTLFIFIIWALINGFMRHNTLSNIFFDFNGWLYFLLVFPLYSVFFSKKEEGERNKFILDIAQIMAASALWLTLETFFLLYVFSHDIYGAAAIYKWIRTTGVGEITPFVGGFFRIFIQSQIFVLAGFFLFVILSAQDTKEEINKTAWLLFLSGAAGLSAILISLSRSFWLGLAVGLFFFFPFMIRDKFSLKKILSISGRLVVMAVLSFIILIAIAKFPIPKPIGNFDAAELLSGRATDLSGEAGASSRWALLPKLEDKIKQSPFLGSGFGTTVTYQTKDPRILESNPTGEYTTYAFEWGWLDIWLKFGLLGLLSYIILIGAIIYAATKKNSLAANDKILNSWFAIGLIAICVVSISSPYTNHPLGIGYLILAAAALENSFPKLI